MTLLSEVFDEDASCHQLVARLSWASNAGPVGVAVGVGVGVAVGVGVGSGSPSAWPWEWRSASGSASPSPLDHDRALHPAVGLAVEAVGAGGGERALAHPARGSRDAGIGAVPSVSSARDAAACLVWLHDVGWRVEVEIDVVDGRVGLADRRGERHLPAAA